LVEWFVPPTGRNVAPKPGPKAEVEDIFGVWLPSGSVAVNVLGNFSLPSSLVEPVDILHSFPECNDEGGFRTRSSTSSGASTTLIARG
jgi:hypothetical protein